MKTESNILKKYFLLLLAIVSLSANSGYSAPLPEASHIQSSSEENFGSADLQLWAFTENSSQEYERLIENVHYAVPSAEFSESLELSSTTRSSALSFLRDQRKLLSVQIFPQHFFL